LNLKSNYAAIDPSSARARRPKSSSTQLSQIPGANRGSFPLS
jgi:hypothetical protein